MTPADAPDADWVARLRAGDPIVTRDLWDRYFDKMVTMARKRLRGLPARASDEEDVALSAFKSFCRAVEGGRCQEALAPDGLWTLMMALTARKAVDLWRHETRLKRRAPAGGPDELPDVIGHEPEPELVARMAEECDVLLRRLGDPILRAVALRKMEGYTNAEIAAELKVTPRTVERKVSLIRQRLEGQA